MQIDCPNCAASYQVPDAALASGRTVRCARCGTVWFASLTPHGGRTGEPPDLAPDDDAAAHWDDAAAAGWDDGAALPAAGVALDQSNIDDIFSIDSPHAGEAPHFGGAPLLDAGARALGMQTDDARGEFAPAEHVSIIPDGAHADALTPDDMPPADPNTAANDFAAKRAARRKALARRPKWRMPGVGGLIALMLIAMALLLMFRVEIVRLMPQTASFFARLGFAVNLRGLDFLEIATTRDVHDGAPVFVVEGAIMNVTRAAVDVPRLRFAMRNAQGQDIYAWTAQPTRPSLQPGERLPFLTRLASPPAEAREVSVRFFTRRDLLNGLR